MKKINSGRIIAGAVVVALVGGLAGGGYYWKSHSQSKTVNVYAVNELSTTYWGDDNESYGPVEADHTQSVFLSDTQMVKEVLVQEGDTVKKGDVLMTYDTTLSEVEVEKKDLEIQQMELDLKKAQDNLAKVKTYKPGVSVPERNQIDEISIKEDGRSSGIADLAMMMLSADSFRGLGGQMLTAMFPGMPGKPEETPSQTESETETEVPSEEPTTQVAPSTEVPSEPATETPGTEPSKEEPSSPAESSEEESSSEKVTESSKEPGSEEESSSVEESSTEETEPEEKSPVFKGGRGTEKKPFLYYWTENKTFDQEMMEYLANGRKTAVVKIQLDPEKPGQEEETSWTMRIHKTGSGYTFEMLELCVNGCSMDLRPKGEEEPEEPDPIYPDPDPYWPGGGGMSYTASEIAEMLQTWTEKVRDLDLEIRTAKVEYQKLKKELDNGEIVSEIDGVVKTLRDQDEAKINGEAVINISGGGGYYVKGNVGELDLADLQIGQTVNVMSWENYMTYEGTVVEISDYPLNREYWSGSGNSNVSYYEFTAFIDESAELQDGEYVEITYSKSAVANNHIYLMRSMIRDENGKSYVYVRNESGVIEKRYIMTGKDLWGYYTEIKSGLTEEDWIAFPYGKELKEGAETVEAGMDQLYGYY